MEPVSLAQMQKAIFHIQQSPQTVGEVKLIVCRPTIGERQVLDKAHLDEAEGLVGDNWLQRGYKKTQDGSAHPDMQLNIMNARVIDAITYTREQWPLAGDQLYVDFDLSEHHLPPGTQLKIGSALIEVTAEPHLGCKKFKERFGRDAVLFVNSPEGKALNLRGINAKVIQSGVVHTHDKIEKLESPL